jgi:hypothetical protein
VSASHNGGESRGKPLIAIFIHFRKAFNSVDLVQLPQLLAAYGIPERLCRIVTALYTGISASVRTKDGLSDIFHTETGVLQGDTLAPFIFVLCMDCVIRCAIPCGQFGISIGTQRDHMQKRIGVLAFADDVVLLEECPVKAQQMLTRMETSAATLGLRVNSAKTKALVLNIPLPVRLTTREGDVIEVVDSFLYLGALLPCAKGDFDRRRGLAWSALGRLQPILDATADLRLKSALFVALVESVLTYGAETWPLSATQEKKVDQLHSRLLRAAVGIRWPTRMSNVDLFAATGLYRLSDTLRRRRRLLVCASQRRSATNSERQSSQPLDNVLLWRPAGKFRPGQHRRQTFLKTLVDDAKKEGESFDTWLANMLVVVPSV